MADPVTDLIMAIIQAGQAAKRRVSPFLDAGGEILRGASGVDRVQHSYPDAFRQWADRANINEYGGVGSEPYGPEPPQRWAGPPTNFSTSSLAGIEAASRGGRSALARDEYDLSRDDLRYHLPGLANQIRDAQDAAARSTGDPLLDALGLGEGDLEALAMAMFDGYGGYGGYTDPYAGDYLALEQQAFQEGVRQFNEEMQLRQAQLAQQAEMERLAREQRRREMAAQIGQHVANLQSQMWAEGIPNTLPTGTQFAPGFEPGGPVHAMYRQAGLNYQPTRLAETPPPSQEQMTAWIEDIMRRFG